MGSPHSSLEITDLTCSFKKTSISGIVLYTGSMVVLLELCFSLNRDKNSKQVDKDVMSEGSFLSGTFLSGRLF